MILAIPSPLGVALGIAAAAAYGFAPPRRPAEPAGRPVGARPGPAAACRGARPWHGRPRTRFGFAPALSVTAWLVLTVYAVESRMYPQLQRAPRAGWLGAAAVLLAIPFPARRCTCRPRPGCRCTWRWASPPTACSPPPWCTPGSRPAPRSRSAWPPTPQGGVPLLTLERLTFRFVTAGFVLLSATLLAGLLFSEQLYGAAGRAWKWDHKTVFSVLAWISFAVLLIGRARFGWRGRTARRVLYAGSALLLLAYVGSRFVLEVVLARPPA